MSSASTDLDRLHDEQRRAYEEAQREQAEAEAAERAQYPDAQWSGPTLRMPAAPHDPTPQEQQAFADRYRDEHLDADRLDQHGETPLDRALYEWRDQEAQHRYLTEADAFVAAPRCDVCGANGAHAHFTIGDRIAFACSRCRASVAAAWADAVACETLEDGRTRREHAAELVATLLAERK
jgi:hypothetical protein